MKILHVIDTLHVGGAENLLVNSAPIFQNEYDCQIDVLIISNYNTYLKKQLSENGINTINLNSKNVYSPNNIFKIRNIIEKENYDIVHTHLFSSQLWTACAQKLIRKNSKTKFITTEHNTYNRRRNFKALKWLDKYLYSRYSSIISISEDTKSNLIKWLEPQKSDLHKFKVIDNGIPLKKYMDASPVKLKEIIPSLPDYNIKVVCMVSRFSEQKDHATLVKAIKKLPEDVHLLLIGSGSDKEINKSRLLVSKLKIEKRVHFLGIRNDVEKILKISDVMVLSSNWEGFGLVAVEGMAAGLPVVVSDVSGLNNVVKDEDLKFRLGNSNELAGILSRLLSDSKFYKAKREYSINRCKDFSIDNYVSNIMNEYRSF